MDDIQDLKWSDIDLDHACCRVLPAGVGAVHHMGPMTWSSSSTVAMHAHRTMARENAHQLLQRASGGRRATLGMLRHPTSTARHQHVEHDKQSTGRAGTPAVQPYVRAALSEPGAE
jgi:integrase